MKKLFVLFAVAGFVLTSCGSNAPKEEEAVVTEQTADTVKVEAADSTVAVTDSTAAQTVVE
ncbi:MAG: entericidin [Bacteroidia bacterium]|jgi:uncharacterized protein YcfL|nr:entericidin [Rikenellaceae bacterium]NCB18955.1 entericidin [Bacteroidia bacterium]